MASIHALAIRRKMEGYTTANRLFLPAFAIGDALAFALKGCEVGEEPYAEHHDEDKRSTTRKSVQSKTIRLPFPIHAFGGNS